MKKQNNLFILVWIISAIISVNLIASFVYYRFDLTQDKRYTVSEATKNILAKAEAPIIIDVLLDGNFPAEFQRLKDETAQLLEEFNDVNRNINYNIINPLEGENDPLLVEEELFKMGLTPAEVELRENGKISMERIYPWAIASYNDKTVKIPLLVNTLGATSEERVNNSIQNLEYAFADGIQKLVAQKSKSIAILKGNGELADREIASFLSTVKEYYGIAPFVLDSVANNPQRTLKQLTTFDLIVVAKPTEKFSEAEKYVLDQYIMNGGASLWLIDENSLEIEPMSGDTYLVPRALGLGDLFFSYGIRINNAVVKDMYSAPIVLAQGTAQDSQYNKYPWFYYPLSSNSATNPIVTNIEGVKFEYTTPIEILENNLTKTILLSTSPISATAPVPHEINYDIAIPDFLKIVNEGPNPQVFNKGEMPLAVLLEGTFTSAYNNRIKPFKISESTLAKDKSTGSKMIVISDGDIIKNQFDNGRPLPTGFDKLTQTMYGNKSFLLNSVNYLLDDTGLINIRAKKITIPFLDMVKVQENRSLWQGINLLAPLGLLVIFGIVFNYFKKRKYHR